jgi:hypothetical protein
VELLLEPISKKIFGILDRILVPKFSSKQTAVAGQPEPHPVPDEALGCGFIRKASLRAHQELEAVSAVEWPVMP